MNEFFVFAIKARFEANIMINWFKPYERIIKKKSPRNPCESNPRRIPD